MNPSILDEAAASLAFAARHWIPIQPNDKPASPVTMWRWWSKGLKNPHTGQRVYLEVVRVGGRVMTSKEAIERFFHALSEKRPVDELKSSGLLDKTGDED